MPHIEPLIDRPIITPDMLPDGEGDNINGPSLVEMPPAMRGDRGRWHCYFGHHHGQHIRLAHADDLAGPWTIHAPGVIPHTSVPAFAVPDGHVSSPEAVLDGHRLILFVHGVLTAEAHAGYDCPLPQGVNQATVALTSTDGITFAPPSPILSPFYLRVFSHRGQWYGISWGGLLSHAADGLMHPFTPSHPIAPGQTIRHIAIDQHPDGRVLIYFTRIGDCPESIMRGRLDTTGDWTTWHLVDLEAVRRPTAAWEGADLPAETSRRGAILGPSNALRDPAIYRDGDSAWLLWSVAGEQGIAIGRIVE